MLLRLPQQVFIEIIAMVYYNKSEVIIMENTKRGTIFIPILVLLALAAVGVAVWLLF